MSHIWYRVRKAHTGRRSEPPPETEEGDWHPVWWRARVRVEGGDKGREDNLTTETMFKTEDEHCS